MSVNETGAECSNCGTYNCGYLCYECVGLLLYKLGFSIEKVIEILKTQDIKLESWEIEGILTHSKEHGLGYKQIREQVLEEFVGNLSTSDGEKYFIFRDSIDSLLKSPTEPDKWLDRPDKAGWWWMSHWNDSFNRWDKPISVHVWHVEDYEINSGNVKWLYIEEPTPPEGR